MKLHKIPFFALIQFTSKLFSFKQGLLNPPSLHLVYKLAFSLGLALNLANAKTQDSPFPEVNEKLIEIMLSPLIKGFECSQMAGISDFDPSVLWVKDQDKLDAQTISNKKALYSLCR